MITGRGIPCTPERVAAEIAGAADSPGRVAVGGRVARRFAPRPLSLPQILGGSALMDTTILIAIRRGRPITLKPCRNANGHALRFQWWFPHLGIAADEHVIPEADVLRKQAWTDEEPQLSAGVLYLSPHDLAGAARIETLAWVTELATQRRGVNEHAGC